MHMDWAVGCTHRVSVWDLFFLQLVCEALPLYWHLPESAKEKT
jgi:hypothetical protein